MKDFSLKFYCILTGNNYKIVKGYDSWSQRKVSIFAISILFPTTLWFANGYLLITNVLEGTIWSGIIVACVCGLIIFFIEKVVIMSTGNWMVGAIRLVMACSIAVIGSIITKASLFVKDTNNEVAKILLVQSDSNIYKVKQKYQAKFMPLYKITKDADSFYKTITGMSLAEAKGASSNKGAGVGKITRFDDSKAKEQKVIFDRGQVKIDSLNDMVLKEAATYNKSDGLLLKLTVLLNMTFRTLTGTIIFGIFFTFFVSLELMCLVLKKGLKESIMERNEKMVSDTK